MTPEELLDAVKQIADALRTDLSSSIDAISKRCDAISEDVKASRKADTAGERDRGIDRSMADNEDGPANPTAATRVAADSVGRGEFAAFVHEVRELKKKQTRPMADLNQFADVQARADTVMRALGSAAEPPMAGEDLVAYKIRTTRRMQPRSKRWKGVELQIIAADSVALDRVIEEIRSDAMADAMSTEGMKPFVHREIVRTLPGGHVSREWIGNGSFIKELSRPVRHVAYIGTRTGTGR